MASKQPDPTPPKAGGLWARLFGVNPVPKPQPSDDAKPSQGLMTDNSSSDWAATLPSSPLPSDMATLADELPAAEADTVPTELTDLTSEVSPQQPQEEAQVSTSTAASEFTFDNQQQRSDKETSDDIEPALAPCPACGTPRRVGQDYCEDCGWMFSNETVPANTDASAAPAPETAKGVQDSPSPPIAIPVPDIPNLPQVLGMRLKDRYELVSPIGERQGIARFAARDHSSSPARPVVVVQAALPEVEDLMLPLEEDTVSATVDECLATIGDTLVASKGDNQGFPAWPSIGWEQSFLSKFNHPGLPSVVESFIQDTNEYLVLEVPQGQVLWDAWDDPNMDANLRYGWLRQLAETLRRIHQTGAICESLRPDIITVTPNGQVVINDVGELVSFPVPSGVQIRASLYTAPELVLTPERADGRADLYGFGAMLYALEYLHHGLEEKDFERQFCPKLITDRYPDVHPGFFRLISKSFNRDPNSRFPTDEAIKEDRTGFTELIHTLDVCRKTFDAVRLDIAAWTTTGMVRTGNEDAFSFLHAMESRQDELSEYALALLCDGMGGYEAGEVAAAMALQAMRKYLLAQPIFTALAGFQPPAAEDFSIDIAKKTLLAALKFANREVYTASRSPGKGRRGMGCTAECVYIDNRQVVVGHVGDSRTYHLHEGRLVQLTRDQTLVNRLVELGQLTPEEAENHPRKNELQQAIGGQPDVDPGLYHGQLKRGDWVLVCSDGLTNHIPAADLTMMLSREAMSAEDAARRLMNLVNLRGATDNATIVVVRAT
jgi:PPM family protein phosphatase